MWPSSGGNTAYPAEPGIKGDGASDGEKPVYTKIIEECIKGGGALDNRHEIVEGIMAKYLVIVESPAKAKTINKFLGSNYQVVASNGHVRDLPKSQLGIDIENDFEPKYITCLLYTSRCV